MDGNHLVISKKFEEEMNSLLKQTKEKKLAIYIYISRRSIPKTFIVKGYFQKQDVPQK